MSIHAILDLPYQDMLIGQGKAGGIVRNLLLEVSEQSDGRGWARLEEIVADVLGHPPSRRSRNQSYL